MNFAGTFAVGLLAVGIILPSARGGSQAAAGSPTGNPYAAISERNVFALVPIPTNPPVDLTPPGDPPPKITPNGIMSLFGQWQVLFKVAVPAKGKEPAKDMSYVMAEGERQDDIVVVKIDQPSAVVTFNNHGTVQELPLAAAPRQTAPAATPAGNPGGSGIPLPAGASASSSLNPAVAARLARAAGGTAPPSATGAEAAGTPIGGGTGDKQINNLAQEQVVDPDVAVARMAKNYLETKKKDPAKAALFPLSAANRKAIEAAADQ